VHREFYRQHEGVVELAKISRLLDSSEKGTLHQFRGKTIGDIPANIYAEDEDEHEESEGPLQATVNTPTQRPTVGMKEPKCRSAERKRKSNVEPKRPVKAKKRKEEEEDEDGEDKKQKSKRTERKRKTAEDPKSQIKRKRVRIRGDVDSESESDDLSTPRGKKKTPQRGKDRKLPKRKGKKK